MISFLVGMFTGLHVLTFSVLLAPSTVQLRLGLGAWIEKSNRKLTKTAKSDKEKFNWKRSTIIVLINFAFYARTNVCKLLRLTEVEES